MENTTEFEKSFAEMMPDEIQTALEAMFNNHRERLLRMIAIRMNAALKSFIDPSDVLQESFMEAFRQLSHRISAPQSSSFVWLRLIVGQQLIMFYRRYIQAQKRSVLLEISINDHFPVSDSLSISRFLVDSITSPSLAVRRQELIVKLHECLDELKPEDREILSLRHFERLSNLETAEELNIQPSAASSRYLRALKRFKDVLKKAELDKLLEY